MTRCAIIGTGISGLSTAYFLSKRSNDIQLTLFDRNSHAGGVIRTERINGCIIDAGPDSFLTQKTSASELCTELGLDSELIGSNDAQRKTFIFHEGNLKELPGGMFLMVPSSPRLFLSSNLISWPGKFAALNDLFALPDTDDQAVAEWVERRFGLEVLNTIAEPLLAGIYGADVQKLSLKSALPQIWDLQKRGSTLLQILKTRSKMPAPKALFTTLSHGMQSIVEALQLQLSSAEWKFNTEIDAIESDNTWNINGSQYDVVVIASSSFPRINTPNGKQIKVLLDSVKRNQAIVIALGYKGMRRDGFGWLVPRAERRSVLACTYVTNKFSGRTAPDYFLLRVFIGGEQASRWIDRTDNDIIDEVLSELNRISQIRDIPEFTRVFRWRSAMPEYAVSHSEKIAKVMSLAKVEKNLFITGNLFSGVGIPDCIRHAAQTAKDIHSMLEQK